MTRSYKNVLSVFLMATVLLATTSRDSRAWDGHDSSAVGIIVVGVIVGVVMGIGGPSKLGNQETFRSSPVANMDAAAVLTGGAPSPDFSDRAEALRKDQPDVSDSEVAMQILEQQN